MDKERERIRRQIFDKPKEVAQEQSREIEEPEINPELLRRFPPERIKKIMVKEARRYQQSLKKKWDNWLRGVSK